MPKSASTILITGGTSGLGYECALAVARQKPDCTVVIASRSNTDNAAGKINQALHQANVSYLPLDLSSLANVHEFATSYSAKSFPPISALVMNAGLQFPNGVSYTGDGVEKTFAINHVGHALLFYLLRPHLVPNARIFIVASGTHDPAQKTGVPAAKYTTAEELAHPTPESSKNKGRQRYATSKLCNILWTYALHDHMAKSTSGKDWTVTAFDPGLMPGTALAREAAPVLQFMFTKVMPHLIWLLRRLINHNIHSPRESGEALARLAVGQDVEGVSGKYFEGRGEIKSSVDSYVKEKQEDLWVWTARFVAIGEEEARSFERLE
jgi:NAD(P)-dependent dehydrogenase (short-subunit alcohol dehydrogenase family)